MQYNPSTNHGFFPETIYAFFAFLALAASLKTAIPESILGKPRAMQNPNCREALICRVA